ncbi:MAG: hypothetical protein AMXMBFR33_71720 [Candidatus Xenobia bacterium]
MSNAISFLRTLNFAQRQARGRVRSVNKAPEESFECRGWGNSAPRARPPSPWRLLRAAVVGSTLSAIPLVGAVPLGLLMEGPRSAPTGVSPAMLAGAALNVSCSVAAVFVGPAALAVPALVGGYFGVRYRQQMSMRSL